MSASERRVPLLLLASALAAGCGDDGVVERHRLPASVELRPGGLERNRVRELQRAEEIGGRTTDVTVEGPGVADGACAVHPLGEAGGFPDMGDVWWTDRRGHVRVAWGCATDGPMRLLATTAEAAGTATIEQGVESVVIRLGEPVVQIRGRVRRQETGRGERVMVSLNARFGRSAGSLAVCDVGPSEDRFEFPPIPQSWVEHVGFVSADFGGGARPIYRLTDEEPREWSPHSCVPPPSPWVMSVRRDALLRGELVVSHLIER